MQGLSGSCIETAWYYRLMEESQRPFLKPSAIERLFNRIFGFLVGHGLGMRHNYVLQVQGRKSGKIYSTPVNVLDQKGRLFLVAPRGETQWVRNARAQGRVTLRKGQQVEAFGVRALSDPEKPEILKVYLDSYRRTVQRYFPFPADSPVESFSSIAARYPVFELLPSSQHPKS